MTGISLRRILTVWLSLASLVLLVACGAEAPSYEPGSITVTSSPEGAAILLDGQPAGAVTPATLSGLDPGIYVVSVELQDFVADPETVPVDLKPLENREIEFTLSQTGFRINSPAGARILVGGEDTGKIVPATVSGLDAGVVVVSLQLDGYLISPGEHEVTVVDREIVTLPDNTFYARPLKTVILEGFANVSCMPCPQLTDNLLALTAKPEFPSNRVQFMEFAVFWPEQRDPFYIANPEENADRFTRYQVIQAPDLYVDGVRMADALDAAALEEAVLASLDDDPGFLIDLSAHFDMLDMPVTVTLTALRDVDLTGYELFVAYYEIEVVIEPAPGLNSQTHFHHIFRDRVDDLPDLGSLTAGATERFHLNFNGSPSMTPRYVAVAFVQHKTSHEVLQTGCYLQPEPTKGKEIR